MRKLKIKKAFSFLCSLFAFTCTVLYCTCYMHTKFYCMNVRLRVCTFIYSRKKPKPPKPTEMFPETKTGRVPSLVFFSLFGLENQTAPPQICQESWMIPPGGHVQTYFVLWWQTPRSRRSVMQSISPSRPMCYYVKTRNSGEKWGSIWNTTAWKYWNLISLGRDLSNQIPQHLPMSTELANPPYSGAVQIQSNQTLLSLWVQQHQEQTLGHYRYNDRWF